MDEHDFDQILHTDFHPNTAPRAEHHIQVQQVQQEPEPEPVQEQEVHEHVHHDDPPFQQDEPVEYTLDHVQLEHDSSAIDRFESGSPNPLQSPTQSGGRNGSKSDTHLTAAEKKRKQRELNRLAASRSRKKKQGELGILESHVDELSSENEKLRARLNALQADRPGSSPITDTIQPVASTSQNPLPTVDHHYFRKVLLDLQHCRQFLIKKELELEGLRSGNPDTTEPNSDEAQRISLLRINLTQTAADLSISKAEQKSLRTIIENLRMEKENFAEYKNRITREVDARMAIKQINGVGEGEGDVKQESDVEKALRQVVLWIEETIDKWDKNDPALEDRIPIDPELKEPTIAAA